jgi:hypothetical protein
MSWGLATYTAAETLQVFSPNDAASYYLGKTGAGISGWTMSQIPGAKIEYGFCGCRRDYDDPPFRFNAGGALSLGYPSKVQNMLTFRSYGIIGPDLAYRPPQITPRGRYVDVAHKVYDDIDKRIDLLANASDAYAFGRRVGASESFGMDVLGRDGNYMIDGVTKPLYFQPTATGAIERTATAINSQLNDWGYLPELSPNIVFDQEYDEPPLIFITDSEGVGVTLYGFVRNQGGKYIGACVSSERRIIDADPRIVTKKNWPLKFAAYNSSCKITYFILSPEYPHYAKPDTNHGLIVYSAGGERVFDSRFSLGDTLFAVKPTPYCSCSPSLSSTGYLYTGFAQRNSSSLIMERRSGVCINAFSPVTGAFTHTLPDGTGGYSAVTSIVGRFVAVNNGLSAAVLASGVGYVYWGYSDVDDSVRSMCLSHDFHAGVSAQFSVPYVALP